MKKALVMVSLIVVGAAATAFGQMNVGAGGRQHQPSGSVVVAQQKDVAGDQKMSPEAKQNLAGILKRMTETMQKMTDTFENKAGKESRNLAVMGRMMREMSLQMSEMAASIEKGKIDPQTLTNMQARLDSVNQRIDSLQ